MRLVEIAQAFTEPLILVLDDVHEATDPGVLGGLDVLIRHAPPTLRLVLSARLAARAATGAAAGLR